MSAEYALIDTFSIYGAKMIAGNYKSRQLEHLTNKKKSCFPTDPFTNMKLQNPSLDVPYLHIIYRSLDLEVLKLGKS